MISDDFFYIDKRDLKRVKDKDLIETVEEVFDTRTLLTIHDLINKKIIYRMNGVVSAGKESRVYLAYGYNNEQYAVKIYLTSTAVFRKGIMKYITGDPRFIGFKPSDTRRLIYMWTRKEYRNLKRMHSVGVKVPKPIAFQNNILVMEFIGENGRRYPLLIEAYSELDVCDLARIYDKVIDEYVKIICKAQLVHGDYSAFNIMVKPDLDIVVIDVGQSVDLSHPNALDFLNRDIRNINRFFRNEIKLDSVLTDEEVYERIKPCLAVKKVDLY
ncbi:MAG: serine protein kinase RIO [Desulfurococcaceae archaeon]